MVDPAVAAFRVSWQDEGDGRLLEEAEVVGAEAAIAWGRERSPLVWISLGRTVDTSFSAGDEHPWDDDPEEAIPHWPPTEPPPEGWWHPSLGSRLRVTVTVYLVGEDASEISARARAAAQQVGGTEVEVKSQPDEQSASVSFSVERGESPRDLGLAVGDALSFDGRRWSVVITDGWSR